MPSPPGYVRPSREYSSKRKELAAAFCKELVRRGLRREFERNSPLPPNTFRAWIAPATRTLPLRYRIRYRDCTPESGIEVSDRLQKPFKKRPPKPAKAPARTVPCKNLTVGCRRPRAYLDGYCKRCHDRREYWSKPELRARKIAQAAARKERLQAARMRA